jgi:GTP-binding protein Era
VARPWELPEGRPTDLTDEQRAMDIVRQHLLDRLHKEIPYKVVVKPVSWEERGDGALEIRQDLVVDRKKIKAMVVGRGGATIK